MIKKKICIGVAVVLAIAMSLVSPVIAATAQGVQGNADVSENQQPTPEERLVQLGEKLEASIQCMDRFLEQKAFLNQQLQLLKNDNHLTEDKINSYIVLLINKERASKQIQRQLVTLSVEYNRLARELGGEEQSLLQEINDAIAQLNTGWVRLNKENDTIITQIDALQEYLNSLNTEPEGPAKPEVSDRFDYVVDTDEENDDNAGETDAKAWITPVIGYTISSPFGMRMHPILGYERMHNGIDMSCLTGTEIHATRAGKVIRAEWSDSAGYYVQIDHGDGFVSEYMHMTNYLVSVGDYVVAGRLIGYVGSTGLSDGSHLHFGISFEGGYVDPQKYING